MGGERTLGYARQFDGRIGAQPANRTADEAIQELDIQQNRPGDSNIRPTWTVVANVPGGLRTVRTQPGTSERATQFL